MPADRGIHDHPRAKESTMRSARFVRRLPFSLFVLRSARAAPTYTATLRNLPVVLVGRQWVKRDSILVNLIPGLGAHHYYPSQLGWARSRITPLQQTFSPRTMHPMSSPPSSRLRLPVSLFLVYSRPASAATGPRIYRRLRIRKRDGGTARLLGRLQKIPEVVIRMDCSEFMARSTCVFDFVVDLGIRQTQDWKIDRRST